MKTGRGANRSLLVVGSVALDDIDGYYVGREGQTKPGVSLRPQELWWQHTAGAAQALGLEGVIGNLREGCEADFVVLDPEATPLLARKTRHARDLDELLFSMIVLGDDRVVEQVHVQGAGLQSAAGVPR